MRTASGCRSGALTNEGLGTTSARLTSLIERLAPPEAQQKRRQPRDLGPCPCQECGSTLSEKSSNVAPLSKCSMKIRPTLRVKAAAVMAEAASPTAAVGGRM